ncbi:hypothetical protein ACLIKD_12100 [Azonexus sp. IMCC34842]|uniref:hypothetical protein n=1 Tax=Azonexus sp. IMCC34842 TaxID=3420950 RepID=UPI003D10C7A5
MTLRGKWLAPLVFFQVYLGITILLYLFGPWPWGTANQDFVVGYLMLAQVFIAFGYFLSWRKVSRIGRDGASISHFHKPVVTFLKVALLVNYAFFIPSSLSRTGALVPDIIFGLTSPGLSYNLNFERLEQGNSFVFVEYARMLLSPWIIGLFPVAVVHWKSLSRSIKYLSFGAVLLNISLFVGTGTNKGLADFVITLPWLISLGVSLGYLNVRLNSRILVVFGVLIVALFGFFGAGQVQRAGDTGVLGAFDSGDGIIFADRDHFVSIWLPDFLVIVFESITRYVTQGYYALSLTFTIVSDTTFGFGNSMFLARNADALTGSAYFTSQSLPGLLEQSHGWSMTGLWHSIYPWLASDFGFFGALIVVGGFGYILGLSWGLSLVAPHPINIIICYFVFIVFYYIPANNQIFQSGETAVGFVLCCLYALTVGQKKLTFLHSNNDKKNKANGAQFGQ